MYGPKRFYAEVIVTVFKTSKLLFFVKNKGQWNAKSGPKVVDGNVAMRNKIFGTFGVEMRACGQKLVKFCTLTHAAKLVVEINAIHALICEFVSVNFLVS